MKFSWKHDLCYYTSCHLDGPIKLMGPSIYRLPMPDPRWFLQRYLFKKTELRSKKCKINQLNIQLSIDPAPWMLNDTASPATDAAILWALGDFSTASILKSKWTYYKMYLKKKKKSSPVCLWRLYVHAFPQPHFLLSHKKCVSCDITYWFLKYPFEAVQKPDKKWCTLQKCLIMTKPMNK